MRHNYIFIAGIVVACGGRVDGTVNETVDASGSGGTSGVGINTPSVSAGGSSMSSSSGVGGASITNENSGLPLPDPKPIIPCTINSDCPSSTDSSIPNGICKIERCVYPVPSCDGKTCGDQCESDSYGTKYCNSELVCAHGITRCFGDEHVACTAMDAFGIQPSQVCNTVYGWAWDGVNCQAVVGCGCRGTDCSNLFFDDISCGLTYLSCRK